MAPISAFVRLSRLKFLIGGLLGVTLGVAMAHRAGYFIDWTMVVLAQITITALQLMTHYSNEYFDREADALAIRTPFSGGSGVLTAGELHPRVALVASLCCMLTALTVLVVLVLRNHAAAAGLGTCIAVLAWFYSAPPIRLHSQGLGEATTALVVGTLVACFSYAVLTNALSPLAVLSTLPAACAMFIMMLCVEYPDVEADRASGKRNLLVRFGRESAPTLVAAMTTGIVFPVFLAIRAGAPRPLVAVAMLSLLLSVWLRARLNRGDADPAWVAFMGVAIFVVTLAGTAAAYALPL